MIHFQLTDKKTKKKMPLSEVDDIICKECLNVPVHPIRYGGDWNKSQNTFNWFDTIGFQIASGKTLEEGNNSVRKYYQEAKMWEEELETIEKIISFLQERYNADSW